MKSLSDLTAQCIRCGFCLESCPTFAVTGDESQSPRGRIYLVRSAEDGEIDWGKDVRPSMDTCLGCRACETACPSGVEYGEILELARQKLDGAAKNRPQNLLIDTLSDARLASLQVWLSSLLPGDRIPNLLSQLLSGQSPEAAPPVPQTFADWPSLNESELPAIKGEVFLLEGCVMRVLFPRVHQATRRLLRRVGWAVKEIDGGCCGALHAHSGLLSQADKRAEKLCQSFQGSEPIIVNSAGCGSTIKSYGGLIAKEHKGVAERTMDVTEFLLREGLGDLLEESPGIQAKAAYHDACHLSHGQGVRKEPRELLSRIPGLKLVPLPESEMCCGSAGTYNLTQPKMARELLTRKWKNIESTGASIVVQGNPGCHAWIAQAAKESGSGVQVLHTAEILESSFSGPIREA